MKNVHSRAWQDPFELRGTRWWIKKRKEPHLRTAQGHPSFLVSRLLPYIFESSKMGKENMRVELGVGWIHGSSLKALSRHFFRALTSKEWRLSSPTTLPGALCAGDEFASFPFYPSSTSGMYMPWLRNPEGSWHSSPSWNASSPTSLGSSGQVIQPRFSPTVLRREVIKVWGRRVSALFRIVAASVGSGGEIQRRFQLSL